MEGCFNIETLVAILFTVIFVSGCVAVFELLRYWNGEEI